MLAAFGLAAGSGGGSATTGDQPNCLRSGIAEAFRRLAQSVHEAPADHFGHDTGRCVLRAGCGHG